MMKNAFGLSLAFGILAWAAPQRTSTPASADLDPIRKEIGQLKETLALLDNRLGHLESAPAASDLDPVKQEIAQLKETLARLDNTVGHVESYASAASAENELTAMTIDSVRWSDGHDFPKMFRSQPRLLCHVVEWRGYGKMLRFVRMSDPTFELQADGHPVVKATMETGGMTSSDGSTRFVMLDVGGTLDPNTSYHLRPRNENEQYRWSVPADLSVVASDAKR
jgi:hypothetical protein